MVQKPYCWILAFDVVGQVKQRHEIIQKAHILSVKVSLRCLSSSEPFVWPYVTASSKGPRHWELKISENFHSI